MDKFIIAIDGPAGAGKSTIAKAASERLSAIYVDTGAMYRAAALYAMENGIDKDEKSITDALGRIDIEIKHECGTQHIYLNGRDVSSLIRTPEVSMGASMVAAIPAVRLKLVEIQRKLAENQSVVMDGRDIGTYVFPDADVKIFLTASPEQRAKRRFLEMTEKGMKADYSEILDDIKKRDINDAGRSFAPLVMADDAVLADTSELNLEESIEKVIGIIKNRLDV